MSGSNNKMEKDGFGTYASLRVVIGIVVVMGCLWLGSLAISFFSKEGKAMSPYQATLEDYPVLKKVDGAISSLRPNDQEGIAGTKYRGEVEEYQEGYYDSFMGEREDFPMASADSGSGFKSEEAESVEAKAGASEKPAEASVNPEHGKSAPAHAPADIQRDMTRQVIGTAFVDALCQPLKNELENRFWGWRPNDIWLFKFGMDNVENYQLGLIEMTRRTVNILSERISRTGTNVYINENLQKARSNLNIDPTRFWFPSAENEYERAIRELKEYIGDVGQGKAYFFTRSDNLIPLLMEFRTQLGDIDNKLIRMEGDPRSQVSTFEADNRFYYAKGVASVILPLLKAIEQDFYVTLKSRDGLEPLHHAIEACEGAAHLSPWIVFEGNYDGILANHRANMSTYVSHARFYIGVLITALAT